MSMHDDQARAVPEGAAMQWYEGMLLEPAHFQQQHHHHQYQLRAQLRALHPHGYGLLDVAIDQAALDSGLLQLRSCRGISADGCYFDCPHGAPLPASRPLQDLVPPGSASVPVALAIAGERADAALCSSNGEADGRATRYRSQAARLHDRNAHGGDAVEAMVQVPHLRLLIGDEGDDESSRLAIGALRRDGSGAVTFDERAVGACLHVGAATALRAVLDDVTRYLVARSDDLAGSRRQRSAGFVEFTVSEIGGIFTLQAINGAIPELLAWQREPRSVHPASLHQTLASLLARLLAVTGSARPADLPPYQHDAPLAGLEALLTTLRETLQGGGGTSRYLPLPVRMVNERIARADLPGELDDQYAFYLAVQSELPADKVMNEVPSKSKVASAERINMLMAQALRGLDLEYVAVPPSEIPARPGHQYFALQCEGTLWDQMREDGNIAIYLPPDFAGAALEFFAVRI